MLAAALLVGAAGPGNVSEGDIVKFILLLLVLLVVFGARKRRSRYIPVKSRRLAQAETVQKHYADPNTANKPLRLRDYDHHHKHLFSRGGSSEPENIELITRKEHRRKHSKPRSTKP